MEKTVGHLIVKDLEKQINDFIIQKKPAREIKALKEELVELKDSITVCDKTLVEICEIAMANIQILMVYIYTVYAMNVIDTHGGLKENYLLKNLVFF